MAQNLQIDPVKKDYVIENGSPIASDRVLEASYYALLIPQGKWLYGNTDQGSLLYTLESTKRTSAIEQLFSNYAIVAIEQQVVNTGKATGVQVTNLQATRNGTSNEIDVIPSTSQLSNQLNFNSVG